MRVEAVDNWKDGARAAALLYDYLEWVRAATGIDLHIEQPGLAAELRGIAAGAVGPDSALFLAYLSDLPAGTIGLRYHDDGAAEIKRMYVRPVARGRNVAAALIERALAEATERRCRRVWLETLPGAMDPAIALYRRCGFSPVEGPAVLQVEGIQVMERHLLERVDCA